MSSASWALQQAIFAALSNDAALKTLVGDPPRVFDAVPRGSAFPYLVLAEDGVTRWGDSGGGGFEHALVVRIWSRGGGRGECKRIADALCDCLDEAELTLSGHQLVDLRFQTAVFGRESDGKTFSGRLEFRAVTEPET
jgi:hypothetical protein